MAENRQAAGDRSYQVLEAELSKLRDDVGSLAGTVRDIASDEVHATVDAIRDRLDKAAGEARKAARRAKAGANDAADAIEGAIEEHPFTSILIALGLGFLIGAFLRR
ncbi:MAG TPA: hypothetical protein VLV76_28010 [Candidatus Acidoferrum sp.]|nr:hypothetical protein [Candidatus Acidoferrum sp.]